MKYSNLRLPLLISSSLSSSIPNHLLPIFYYCSLLSSLNPPINNKIFTYFRRSTFPSGLRLFHELLIAPPSAASLPIHLALFLLSRIIYWKIMHNVKERIKKRLYMVPYIHAWKTESKMRNIYKKVRELR